MADIYETELLERANAERAAHELRENQIGDGERERDFRREEIERDKNTLEAIMSADEARDAQLFSATSTETGRTINVTAAPNSVSIDENGVVTMYPMDDKGVEGAASFTITSTHDGDVMDFSNIDPSNSDVLAKTGMRQYNQDGEYIVDFGLDANGDVRFSVNPEKMDEFQANFDKGHPKITELRSPNGEVFKVTREGELVPVQELTTERTIQPEAELGALTQQEHTALQGAEEQQLLDQAQVQIEESRAMVEQSAASEMSALDSLLAGIQPLGLEAQEASRAEAVSPNSVASVIEQNNALGLA